MAAAGFGAASGVAAATPNGVLAFVATLPGAQVLGAEWLAAFDSRELPMPAGHLVVVLHALIEGLVMQRILTPDLCPDDVFYEAFTALARRP